MSPAGLRFVWCFDSLSAGCASELVIEVRLGGIQYFSSVVYLGLDSVSGYIVMPLLWNQ